MKHVTRLPLVVFALLLGASAARAEFALVANTNGVLANRLEGTWQVDEALTTRLSPAAVGEVALLRMTFRPDPDVLLLLPQKYETAFADRPIHLAGTLKLWTGDVRSFVLTVSEGTPTVTWFGEEGNDPFGRTGAFHVMLASGDARANDLLFLRDSDSKTGFRAYKRDARTR